jgi:hypothetical protein
VAKGNPGYHPPGMEHPPAAPGPAPRRLFALWPLLFLALVAWQGWMTLTLFGPERPWERLFDDQPVLSGRHPLHLYHGYLGAHSLWLTGRLSCYDFAFQTGYLKTPVFDSGSRPAELFLALTGGEYWPAAYKVGLALCCLLVPWLLLLACRGAGLCAPATVLATAAGLFVWWGAPGRQALEAGEIELLLAALAVLAHVGLLVHYHRSPGLRVWLGLLATGALGWFAHPLLFPLLLPLLLVYYLSVGARHPRFRWHLALFAAQAGALAVNLFWLADWVTYWWLRCPLPHATGMLRHRTVQTVWDSPMWGGPADRNLGILLLGSALVGLVVFNTCRQRVAARLLGLGAGGLWVLAVLGISWEPLGQLGTAGLMVPALWFAALPAAHAWTRASHLLVRVARGPWRAALAGSVLLAAAVLAAYTTVAALAEGAAGTAPLVLGLGPDREALVQTLRTHTGTEARILWEDRPVGRDASRWSALLPVLTGRTFIGGLDPEAGIEHSKAGLIKQELAGHPVGRLSDAALEEYCRRYNVGWVVCWSPAAVARFRAWKGGATEVAEVKDGGTGYLFRVHREKPSLALEGQAELLHADLHHLTLADVVPANGKVLLSLHYQAGMRASPGRVQVEPAADGRDLVPFVRLRVSSPVARVILTWDDPRVK